MFGGTLNAVTRDFGTGVRAASYWIGNRLLSASDVVNDSSVTGATVKAALNYLSTASTAVFPFTASSLAEQDLVSYDAGAATWRNRTKAAALSGTGANSFVVGTGSFATGADDIFVGQTAGASAYSGTGLNIGIGKNTLKAITTSNSNTVVGHNAAQAISSGIRNTVFGASALQLVATGQRNVALGYAAMQNAADAVSFCVAVGNDVLVSVTSLAGRTVSVGDSSLFDLTDGAQNTGVGVRAGKGLTTGARNTFLGFISATASSATASDNTFIGNEIGNINVGSRNSVVGSLAFNSAAAVVKDCAVLGYNALSGGLTTGANGSVAVGSSALAALTSGVNTAVGYQAGLLLTTGTGNCINGYQAGNILTTGSSMTIFGHDADGDAASRSGCVVLGRGATAAADDTLVIRMGDSSAKEIVITPVVTSTPVSTVSNLPLTVGGTSYTIPLGPASYTYNAIRTSDQVIAVNGTVVSSTLAVTVPGGTYSFAYSGHVTRSTASGGAISIGCSTDTTVTSSSQAYLNGSATGVFLRNSATVLAGTHGDIIYDTANTGVQWESATGTLTCATTTTFTIAVYCAGSQNITLHTGSSFTLTKTN